MNSRRRPFLYSIIAERRQGAALIAAALALLIISSGCAAAAARADGQPAPEAGRRLTRFSLTLSSDLPSRRYALFRLGGGCYLYSGAVLSHPVGEEVAAALEAILEAYHVDGWNGFSGNNPNVLDGEAFYLSASYSDGTEIQASGSNAFPEHYFPAVSALEKLLNQPEADPFASVSGTYRYASSESGPELIIRLYGDGAFACSGSAPDSVTISGEWWQDGPELSLYADEEPFLYDRFMPVPGALLFAAEGSDAFPSLDVPDAARFIRTGEACPSDGSVLPMTVGEHIPLRRITSFYYTYDSSAYPPDYLRWQFYTEDGARWFHYETRAGHHWPLTEDDIADSVTAVLPEETWLAFLSLLEDGAVSPRHESLETGGSGPWLYLYWDGDQGIYQEYAFPSDQAEAAFIDFCTLLKNGVLP